MATMTSAFPFKIPDDPLQAGSRPNSCSTNPNIHPVIAPTEFSDLSFWESFSSNSPCELSLLFSSSWKQDFSTNSSSELRLSINSFGVQEPSFNFSCELLSLFKSPCEKKSFSILSSESETS
ncbi:uncharacterized protein LOC26527083 [Drosophila erecta]|uniref:uncharacterized protein LOC26527083 n=1 Tax=Drosophila erecta TaxID=7220 RepID=UPI000F046925|nr:uncharacterized protein LOC26527083 [Drosophila erecta]